jgi:polysaccharide export outer membrane protein
MTSSDMEKLMVVALGKDYFVDPQIHIRIMEYHSLNFFISGAVKKPGKYEMQAATTIMDLIAKAEGLTLESGNVAYIMREGSGSSTQAQDGIETVEPIKVNLIKLLDKGDMSHNVALATGDSIYIPFAKGLNQSDSKVYISGEVDKPALYEYQPGMSALSVCIMAGGFAKYAAPNRTTIVRTENGEQKVMKINLEDVVKGKIPDIPLKPGDRIHVPESWL